jgi:aldehyde reductase
MLYILLCSYQEGEDLSPVDADGKPQYSGVDFTQTWLLMEKCVELGLTKSIGVSNFNSEQLEKVLAIATIKPVVNQVIYRNNVQSVK